MNSKVICLLLFFFISCQSQEEFFEKDYMDSISKDKNNENSSENDKGLENSGLSDDSNSFGTDEDNINKTKINMPENLENGESGSDIERSSFVDIDNSSNLDTQDQDQDQTQNQDQGQGQSEDQEQDQNQESRDDQDIFESEDFGEINESDLQDQFLSSEEKNDFICNPFSQEQNENVKLNNGLLATLFDGRGFNFEKLDEYFSYGIKLKNKIYFSNINVPTRAFERGFITNNGKALSDINDNILTEFFALKFEGKIGISNDMEEGLYEFAILADDGVELRVENEHGDYDVVASHLSKTPTRLVCSTKSIYFTKGEKKNLILDYYQGPRKHIALLMLWRKVDMNNNRVEKLCGKSGNSLFFNSNVLPSKPLPPYLSLLDRGWKVVGEHNFFLPGELRENPCL